MNLRIWLAILIAPAIGGVVYSWIGYLTLVGHVHGPNQPTVRGLFTLGSVLGLAFVLVALAPLHMALRHWNRLSVVAFFIGGLTLWFIASTAILALLGDGWNAGSATAVSM